MWPTGYQSGQGARHKALFTTYSLAGAATLHDQQKRALLAVLRTLASTDDLVARGYVLAAAAALTQS